MTGHQARIWISLTLTMCLLLTGLTGCSLTRTAVLPTDDPLCGVIPADILTPMIPNGVYHFGIGVYWKIADTIAYVPHDRLADGDCRLITNDKNGPFLYVSATQDYGILTSGDVACDDPSVMTAVHGLGEVWAGGMCTHGGVLPVDKWAWAWIVYRGGGNNTSPAGIRTRLGVQFSTRSGRDGLADAVRILQLLVDFIDANSAAEDAKIATTTPTASESPR